MKPLGVGLAVECMAMTCMLGCGAARFPANDAEVPACFRGDGYYHESYPLRVVFGQAPSPWPLAARWEVDNFQRAADGTFVSRKRGPRYDGPVRFDTDDDGVYETKETYPRFELLLNHRRTDASIWLSTLPIPIDMAGRDLRVFVDRYVEGVSGTGTVRVQEFSAGQHVAVADQRYATRLTELRQGALDGVAAVSAIVEVANVDQLEASPNATWERAKVVFVRPSFGYVRQRDQPLDQTTRSWPVLVMLGYSNSARDFSRGLPDFSLFLAEIDLLNDRDILTLHAPEILGCLAKEAATVVLSVDASGSANATIDSSPDECVTSLLHRWSFPVTGQPRRKAVRLARGSRLSSATPNGYREGPPLPNPSSDPPEAAKSPE